MHNHEAGWLSELEYGKKYSFQYLPNYEGEPISLTMPKRQEAFNYEGFPPFFDGLLPEGVMLEGLLKSAKLDRYDLLGQLLSTGKDMVGAVTVGE